METQASSQLMQLLLSKEAFSVISILFTLAGFYPYVRGTLSGVVRPHVFSWVIWAITTLVVFAAQLYDGGGAGAWPIGISGVITVFIAWLAWVKRQSISITRLDRWFFAAAVSSLPIWFVTSDPMWAVIVLTFVDVLAFWPTARKITEDPYSESMMFFVMGATRNVFAIMALEHYSITTALFPAAIGSGAVLMILLMLAYRPKRSLG